MCPAFTTWDFAGFATRRNVHFLRTAMSLLKCDAKHPNAQQICRIIIAEITLLDNRYLSVCTPPDRPSPARSANEV